MIFRVTNVLLLILFFTFSNCENSSNKRLESELEINESVKSIREARINDIYSTEVKKLLDSLSNEVVYIEPNENILPGQLILQDFIMPYSDQSMEMIPEGIEINDTVAIEWGLLIQEEAIQGNEEPEVNKSSYIFFYERLQEDKWTITKEIYNKI